MDDSFDELFVPDNWLELGVKRGNQEEEVNNDASSPKRLKRSHEGPDTNQLVVENNNSTTSSQEELTTVITDSNKGVSDADITTKEPAIASSIPIKESTEQELSVSQVLEDSVETLNSSDKLENASLNEPDIGSDDCILTHPKKSQEQCESNETSGSKSLYETNNVNDAEKSKVDLDKANGISNYNDTLSASVAEKSSTHKSGNISAKSNESRDAVLVQDAEMEHTQEIHLDAENNHPNVDLTNNNNGTDIAKHTNSPTQTTSAAVQENISLSEKEIHLKKISSIVRDAKIISSIVPNRNFNDIYDKLLDHREKEDRLDFVTSQLIDLPDNASTSVTTVDIFEEVQKVIAAVPSADANEVYTILESLPPSLGRVVKVVQKLKATHKVNDDGLNLPNPKPAKVRKDSSIADDPLLQNDPLFRDMRTIAKMFPEMDRNEIYALLEANHKRENRLQAVINEILSGETAPGNGAKSSQTPSLPANTAEGTSGSVDKEALSIEEIIREDVERMKVIFPDCDPNHLFEKLDSMKDKPDRRDLLAAEMFDKRDYPKLKDTLQKEEEKRKKEKARKLDLTVEEFLKRFPDPKTTFGDMERKATALYLQHAEVALKNEFPMLKSGYIKSTLTKNRGHLYPAYQELSDTVVHTPISQRKTFNRFMKTPRCGKIEMPKEIDEFFYHELWLVQNELSVLDYPKQKEEERRLKLEEAKLRGELYECCCCYEDECLFEDLASCPEGHLFCKTCVQRSAEAAFGEMKTNFPCLTGECDQNITLNTLQSILSAKFFSKIVRRLQEEEVQQANIPDLVICPFCPFATIMPNPDDKVFKCLNPDCLKESCRLCQEPNHIPLRCNEVEKKAATDMRTYIENQISEAVMRKCNQCGKRFVKDTGCNKMTCVCGATSCYACKAQGIDYNHFNQNKKCADTDPDKIHERDMIEAATKAKNQYLLDHPEAADIELNSDVKDMIKDFKATVKNKKQVAYGGYYNDYNEEDENSEYDSMDDTENEEDEEEDNSLADDYYSQLYGENIEESDEEDEDYY